MRPRALADEGVARLRELDDLDRLRRGADDLHPATGELQVLA